MKLSTVAAVSAALAVCAVAGAQTAPYKQVGATVRLGAFLPTNQSTIDDSGSGFFAFGVDYRLDFKAPAASGFTTGLGLSVDYFQRSNVGNTPVLLNFLAKSGKLTYFVGAGIGFETLPGHDKNGFAYAVGADYDLPTGSTIPVFVEAKFQGSDRSEINGVGLFVGVRF